MNNTPRPILALVAANLLILPAAWASGCGGGNGTGSGAGSGTSTGPGTGTGGTGGKSEGQGGGLGGGFIDTGDAKSCVGLECQIHGCTNNDAGNTTITGTIYDPAGKNPLYGVVAYVPNAPVQPLKSGASCDSCSDLYSGSPIAAAVTDANGVFTIQNAPDGANIPLVIQVGKWRRQFIIPSVTMCAETHVDDALQLTLPKNASEGDLPNMAISTGGADTLECLLTRIGVDPAEYTPGAGGTGHVHVFHGTGGPDTSPGAPDSSASLWSSAADIQPYDIVLLSCEGSETDKMNQQVLFDYAGAGGRVFASHFHYSWFNTGPFGNHNLATWKTGSQSIGNIDADVVTTLWDGTPFIRGQALHDWLAGPKVNALTNGLLPIQVARHNADVAMANTASQPWIVIHGAAERAQDFTFDTPFDVDAGAQCGRVAYSDMHVGAAAGDYSNGTSTTPGGCATGDLSPQEKALEFILFDLSSCVTPNNTPQDPPGVIH